MCNLEKGILCLCILFLSAKDLFIGDLHEWPYCLDWAFVLNFIHLELFRRK